MRKNIMSVPIAQHSMLENHFICNILKNVVYTSRQANPISRSNRRRDIVIDEVDEKEFDLSDLSMVSTQFDNKVSYSLKLLSIGSQVLILFSLLDGFDRIYKHFKTSWDFS